MFDVRNRLAGVVQGGWSRRQRKRVLQAGNGSGRFLETLRLSESPAGLRVDLQLRRFPRPLGLSILANQEVLLVQDLDAGPGLGGSDSNGYSTVIDYSMLPALWAGRSPATVEGELLADRGTLRVALRMGMPAGEVPAGALVVEHATEEGPTLRGRAFVSLVKTGAIQPDLEVICHVPVGRAEKTQAPAFKGAGADEQRVVPYINRKGYLAVAVAREPVVKIRVGVGKIGVTDGVLRLSGHASTGQARIISARLLATARKSDIVIAGTATFSELREATATHFGKGRYLWDAALDFTGLDWDELDTADNYDLWIELVVPGSAEPRRYRVANTPYVVRSTTGSGHVTRGQDVLVVNPYYTFKRKATSLLLERLSLTAFNILHDSTAASRALAKAGRKPIWLIGELPYKAQDNGLHFFKYVRANHPEIDAYYVINEDSPELANLAGLGHVLFHHSEEHFRLALLADRFIGSHHPDYLYPTRMPEFRRKAGGRRVFLQHGVMGTKWMVPNYGKRSAGFETDLFCVSSEREKEYIVGDFGYDPAEVVVTGLPRFDSLFADDVEVRPRQVLVIPTWRDWLQSNVVFEESEYLERWKGFLNHPQLRLLAEEHDLELVFCLHPNMQAFSSYFEDAPVRIVRQGEIDVQQLMKQSAAMITDYSSVGFDFSFLGRPVHYFQFDRDRFLGKAGSHLDLDAELPGSISTDVEGLLEHLGETVQRGFSMEPEFARRSDRFILARDRNHSRRVFEAVAGMRTVLNPVSRIAGTEFTDRALARLRRDKRYFGAMRKMQQLARLLPMDKDLVVFESGLGKQYADSPRYIYEELVRRGDTRKKVWIYSGSRRFTDPNTTVVKRLSPQYFWALGRAGYWVTNQSFPYYMTRRRNGTYLQTWHGTPLKRMLHDIEEIQGRDEGYLARVERATAQWSHLLSPSPYATEAMRSSYRYTGPVLELGYPRNDPLLDPAAGEKAAQVRRGLGIKPGQKVVLYAPTFRDNASNGSGRFGFELPFDPVRFTERFGKDTVLLLRMHVLVQAGLEIPPECRDNVINVSGYPEIQELYLASDVLVTDYSSVFFDYALLRRPIVFFAYDLESYRDQLRGFYLDYNREMPGPIVEDEDAFHEALEGALRGELQDGGRREEFIARFSPRDDGAAAARVVEALFEPS